MTQMTHSTNSTPSEHEPIVLVRRSEAAGKWRPLICVEFKGAPCLYLTAEDWVQCGLQMGMPIPDELYAELAQRSEVARALRDALRLLEIRPRFERELSQALLRKGWAQESIDGALHRLREKGLLDDERLVRDRVDAWAGTRSRREIRAKLRSRGAPAELVNQFVAACVDTEQEREAAVKFAEKYFRRAAGRTSDVDERRAVAHLVRKGFSLSAARQAVQEAARRYGEQGRNEWA
ncbi:RecX family transcriptional regulator [Alicyclobacillus mali (ex Roth et al. 2021)]|uniref:regulatory protein RecX n=1 Tax=Alicyclobacillus mali (ex Roth et al. 2021) TaxID=1123961 RepID=UPI0023F4EB3D|nr:RecX family transcriptional regulator [Alicyclobacillus mali (ex Roth et al. 2021)]